MLIAAYAAGSKEFEGKRMGQGGTIISSDTGTADEKADRLTDSGAIVAQISSNITKFAQETFRMHK